MTFVVIENEWRSYRGPKKVFVREREIAGSATPQAVALTVADFKDTSGNSPMNWRQIDQFGICASYEQREPRPWRATCRASTASSGSARLIEPSTKIDVQRRRNSANTS